MDFLRPVGGPTRDVVAALGGWLSSAEEPEPLIVETSGSTGRPKRVVLSRRAVLASVRATERRLGTSGRWLLTLPASYVAGLQVVCRSLAAGHESARNCASLSPAASWKSLSRTRFSMTDPGIV